MSYIKYQRALQDLRELDELFDCDFEALAELADDEKRRMKIIARKMFEFAERFSEAEFMERLDEAELEAQND